jgi:hypothetical protein
MGKSISNGEGKCVVTYESDWANGLDARLRIEAPTHDSMFTTLLREDGKIVLGVRITKNDDFSKVANGVPRAEINFSQVSRFVKGRDYWLSWTTLIPKSNKIDNLQPEIISQIHQSSRGVGSPPFSLMIAGGTYQVDVRGRRGTPSNSYKFENPLADRGRLLGGGSIIGRITAGSQ